LYTHWDGSHQMVPRADTSSWFCMFCMKCYAIGLIQEWVVTFSKKGPIILFPTIHQKQKFTQHKFINEGDGIVQIKIIHMMMLIFHMHTLLCIIFWIKLRNAKKI
jgi:hypothetical protein